jgi:ABC-type polysaccharide/polyol phosphate export permease
MADREFRTKYKKAFLGLLWIFINPVLQMLIIGIVFSYYIQIPNYFLYLFCGLLPWNFFTLSLSKSTSSFLNERALLKKAKFPLEIIPLSIVLANLFHFIAASAIFLIVLIFFGYFSEINILLFLLSLLWITVLTGGIVLSTATLYVRFSDINFLVQAASTVLFYATPIVYKLDMIPQNVMPLFYLNPVTSITQLFQCSLIGSCNLNYGMVASNLIITIFVVIMGIIIFLSYKNLLVDWL